MHKSITEILKERDRSRVNHQVSKLRLKYPNLYKSAGSRYVRKLIKNIFSDLVKEN